MAVGFYISLIEVIKTVADLSVDLKLLQKECSNIVVNQKMIVRVQRRPDKVCTLPVCQTGR